MKSDGMNRVYNIDTIHLLAMALERVLVGLHLRVHTEKLHRDTTLDRRCDVSFAVRHASHIS